MSESDILWRPSDAMIADANMTAFAAEAGIPLYPYDSLHNWSISALGEFWRAVWDFGAIIGDRGNVDFVPAPADEMIGAKFFPNATLNFAENLLAGDGAELAVIESDESGVVRSTTRGALCAEVARIAAGLKALGVGPNDCVAGVLSNTREGLVALLAAASIGAIWSSCSPDFGAAAILDRLGQIAPKVLFAVPTYNYAGRAHDISERIRQVAARIENLTTLILCGERQSLDAPAGVLAQPYDDFGDATASVPNYPRLPFGHPLYVLYTSGTTGKPKAIVHCAGGVLLQHRKEHVLHCDVKPGDVVLWYTNTAWMMYHWCISALASGAGVVLTDGAAIPKTPRGLDAGLLWRVAERAGVTHLGVSPKYLRTVEDQGYRPGARHDLGRLRSLLSAGAPVTPEQFEWVYDAVKRDMMFASICGGTEIIGCFLIGSPAHCVRRGQLTCKALGHAVAVMDERNAPIIGRKGDLVCTEPFPSMPLTFWGADGDERYRRTYFAVRPGIWTHGDLAEMTIHGGAVVYGRTDTTLNPGGVRIGTAEIYAAVESFEEVDDCLVFGLSHEDDEEIVLCVVPAANALLDESLAKRIRDRIRALASPRHLPQRIHAVVDIPYTLNGKRVEAAARSAMCGVEARNKDSLRNPASLEQFAALRREEAL